jgi:hypothetical protein
MASNERGDKLVTDFVQLGKGCKYCQKIKKIEKEISNRNWERPVGRCGKCTLAPCLRRVPLLCNPYSRRL